MSDPDSAAATAPPALDYDDPAVEEVWCSSQRDHVTWYLKKQRLSHGRIGDWPAFHIAPFLSLWAVESLKCPGRIGWWALSGDLPTDYISAANAPTPRQALREFAANWSAWTTAVERGAAPRGISLATPGPLPQLVEATRRRVELLLNLAGDDSLWPGRE